MHAVDLHLRGVRFTQSVGTVDAIEDRLRRDRVRAVPPRPPSARTRGAGAAQRSKEGHRDRRAPTRAGSAAPQRRASPPGPARAADPERAATPAGTAPTPVVLGEPRHVAPLAPRPGPA